MLHPNYYVEKAKQDEIINRKNEVDTSFYNGIYDRFKYPVFLFNYVRSCNRK